MNAAAGSFLALALRELSSSGIDRTIIYCNRPEYLAEIKELLTLYPQSEVVVDEGVSSTFELLKRAWRAHRCKAMLFLYGHSPQPAAHITRILGRAEPVVVSLFRRSSRRSPLRWSSRLYIEPPYKISLDVSDLLARDDWASFFSTLDTRLVGGVTARSPGEFNDVPERASLRRYVASWAPPNKAVQLSA